MLEDTASPSPLTPGSTGEAAGMDAMTAQLGVTGAGSMGAFRMTQPGQVYVGTRTVPGGRGGARGEGGPSEGRQVDVWMTPTQAYEDFYHWDAKRRRDLTSAGILSGQLKQGSGDIETAAWWKQLVDEAAKYGAAGQKMSPLDMAAAYVNAAGMGGGPKTRTTTQTNINISDPMTAKALTTNLFQQLLGRDPQAGELGSFAAALNAAEEGAPSTTTTTSQYDEQGQLSSQSSRTTGGLTAAGEQQLLADKIKSTKEYGVQQAATSFMDLTHKAIWGQPG